MAQKTPVPALTIDRSGTWTSLWYYDTDLQKMWSSNMNLQYAIGAYFAMKRRLVQSMAILNRNNLMFVNVQVLSLTKAGYQSLALASKKIKKVARRLRKRSWLVGVKGKQPRLLKKLILPNQRFRRLRARQRSNYILSFLWWGVNKGVLFNRRQALNNALRWCLAQRSHYLAQSLKVNEPTFLKTTNVRRMKPKLSRLLRKGGGLGRRHFSTKEGITSLALAEHYAVHHPSTALMVEPIFSTGLVIDAKMTQITPVLTRTLYRRWKLDKQQHLMMRPKFLRKKLKKWWPKLLKLHYSYRARNRRKQLRYLRKFMKLSMLKAACQHITSLETRVNVRRYIFFTGAAADAVGRVVFARWQRRRYCYPTIMVVYQSILRGSALLLVNYLKTYLRGAKKHSSMLFLVSAALKFYLQHREEVDRITDLTACAGVRLVADGKVDGSDRAKTFKTQVGAIPTSTFAGPTDVEFAVCGTRYGVLGLYVWYFMKPDFFKSEVMSYFGRRPYRKVNVRNRRPREDKKDLVYI